MESVFLPMQRFLFERELIWIDCDALTVVLQCTNVNNRSVSALTTLESGLVGRTTECVNPIPFLVIKNFQFSTVLANSDCSEAL